MVWCRLVAKIKIKICIADFKLFLHPATQKTTNKLPRTIGQMEFTCHSWRVYE